MSEKGQTCSAILDDYRRRARRIRATCAGDPARLYRSLQDLAASHTRAALTKPDRSVAQQLADLVSDSMDGPVLRYSVRCSLLRHADSRGIGRFEANLIIAAVQHQVDRNQG